MFKKILLLFSCFYFFILENSLCLHYYIENSDFFPKACIEGLIPTIGLTSICILLSSRLHIVEAILFLFIAFWNIASIGQASLFHSWLDAGTLYIMFSSGAGETFNFLKFAFSFRLLFTLLAVTMLPAMLFWLYTKQKSYVSFKNRLAFFLIGFSVMLTPLGLSQGGQTKRSITANIDKHFRNTFYFKIISYLPMARRIGDFQAFVPDNVVAAHEGDQTIILIIGESLNRNHMSIYGYPRKTTPCLDAEPLLIYKDVISPASVTSQSIPLMLTFANLQNKKTVTSLYDIFKGAGFRTYNFSGSKGVATNDIIHRIGLRADESFYLDRDDDERFAYDSELFVAASKVLSDKKYPKKLLVIQTSVAHFPYKPFYPSNFKEFENTPPKLYPGAEPLYANQYDTAVRYFDELVSGFMNEIKKIPACAVIITTDHGQEVADYSPTYGHSSATTFVSCYEIPFLVYLSDDYKIRHPELVFDVTRSYQNDNLIHSVIDLACLKTAFFEEQLSIFNKNFLPKQRLIHKKEYAYN